MKYILAAVLALAMGELCEAGGPIHSNAFNRGFVAASHAAVNVGRGYGFQRSFFNSYSYGVQASFFPSYGVGFYPAAAIYAPAQALYYAPADVVPVQQAPVQYVPAAGPAYLPVPVYGFRAYCH